MRLVWLRNDLRLEDNPALYHACLEGVICCVYLMTPGQWRQHHDAPAKLLFIRERLIALAEELKDKNISLKLIEAEHYRDVPRQLLALAQSIGADSLWFNCEYPLNEKNRDASVVKKLTGAGVDCHCYHGDLVLKPGSVRTQTDTIYTVYSPFARQWRKRLADCIQKRLEAVS